MKKTTIKFNRDFQKESYWLSRCYGIVHAHTCSEESSRLRPLRHRRFHNGYD